MIKKIIKFILKLIGVYYIINFFLNLYYKGLYSPKWYSVFFNPFYFARRELFKSIKKNASNFKGKVLDVGCGIKPYADFFKDCIYVGLEFDTPENREFKKVDLFYDGKTFPCLDAEYDNIICSQVLEHVFNQEQFMNEINRVLKTNGKLLLTVPFIWDEHEQPYDNIRYTSFGLKNLIERHNFNIIEFKKTVADVSALFQLINDYIYKTFIISKKNIHIQILMIILFIAPFNIIGCIFSKIMPKNEDIFLDNVVYAIKKQSKEMP